MIYLDNAATTPLNEKVFDAMSPFLRSAYGNASSLHSVGRTARQAMDDARRAIADWIGCGPRQLIFTSGGTEADASALTGAFLARRTERPHIIVSTIEHHAVLHTVAFLQTLGADVTYVPVDSAGRVHPSDVLKALRRDTSVVSVMSVNNELGTIEPIEEIAQAVKTYDATILVHSDMVQALPFIAHPLSTTPHVDLAVFSAHKIHGPKGVGLLYVRQGSDWIPMLYGGNQEGKRRGGTENVPGIVGFGAAVQELRARFEDDVQHLYRLRDAFWRTIQMSSVDVVRVSPEDGAPTILSLAFQNVRNDTLLMRLDLEGVAASAGSACTAGSLEPSHVVEATGCIEHLGEAVRFSFGVQNTLEEVEEAARKVVGIVHEIVSRGRK